MPTRSRKETSSLSEVYEVASTDPIDVSFDGALSEGEIKRLHGIDDIASMLSAAIGYAMRKRCEVGKYRFVLRAEPVTDAAR